MHCKVSGKKKEISIQTKDGIKKVWRTGDNVFRAELASPVTEKGLWNKKTRAGNRNLNVFFVGIDEPHLVAFVKELGGLDVERIGRELSHKSFLPDPKYGANIDFVKVVDGKNMEARIFERGVERETLSCGTGAAAACFVGIKQGKSSSHVNAIMRGGTIKASYEEGRVFIESPMKEVYEGKLRPPELLR